jgi:hypothetical protein
VGTANIGSRAPACPPFIVVLRERGPNVIHGRRPRSGRGSDRFPDPEITFLTKTRAKKKGKTKGDKNQIKKRRKRNKTLSQKSENEAKKKL